MEDFDINSRLKEKFGEDVVKDLDRWVREIIQSETKVQYRQILSRLDILEDRYEGLSDEVYRLRGEMNGFRTELNQRFDVIDQRFDAMRDNINLRFDAMKGYIDQRIDLDSEARVLADQPGDAPIHGIEAGAEHDEPRCRHVIALDDVAQGPEPAKQIGDRENTGQD